MEADLVKGSSKSYISSLDIFRVPETDVSINESKTLEIQPLSNITDNNGPIQFHIRKVDNVYFNLAESVLSFGGKIVNADNSAINTDNVAPSNLFFNTVFSNCRVDVGTTTTADYAGLFSFRGLIPQILCHGAGEKSSIMTRQLYYPDTKMDDFTDSNLGFKERKKIAEKSNIFECCGRIPTALFEQNRFFPSIEDIIITFTRSLSEFCLDSSVVTKTGQSGTPFKFVFEYATLYLQCHTINPSIQKNHELAFSRKEFALFYLKELEVRSVTIPAGTVTFDARISYTEYVPNLIVLSFLDADAYNGALNKSIQNFRSHGLKSVTLQFDDSSYHYQKICFDESKKLYIRAYQSMLGALDENNLTGNDISYKEYINGKFFLIFKLNRNNSASRFLVHRRGNIFIQLQYGSSTSSAIQMLVMGTSPKLLKIRPGETLLERL